MSRRYVRVALPLLLAAAACASEGGAGLSPRGGGSNEYWFDSLPKMVATSDVVVLGTVIELKPGDIVGEPGDEIELLDAVFDVQEVLYGSADGSSTLTIQTDPFIPTEPEWRTIGNTVLVFMKMNTDPGSEGKFYKLNDQAVYLVTGTDVQETVDHDPFSNGVAAMTIDEIREKIQQAAERIAAGKVKPQPPVFG